MCIKVKFQIQINMKRTFIFLIILSTFFSGVLSAQTWKSVLSKMKDYVNADFGSGDKYKGQLANGQREGLGVYCWTGESYYLGNWTDGDMNGYGIQLAPEGKQITNCSNCAVYVGNWSYDKKSDKGSCYDSQGNLIYYGNFSDNKPTETYPVTGDYTAYKFQTLSYSNDDKYVGETKNGSPHGYGIYVWSKGDAWLGNFEDGGRGGKGIYLAYKGDWTTQNCQNNDCQTMVAYTASSQSNSYAHNHNHNHDHDSNSSNDYTCSSCSGGGKQTCIGCQGAGQQACIVCSGTGINPISRPIINSFTRQITYQRVPCLSCAGVGRTSCKMCYGAGETKCYLCLGTGVRIPPSAPAVPAGGGYSGGSGSYNSGNSGSSSSSGSSSRRQCISCGGSGRHKLCGGLGYSMQDVGGYTGKTEMKRINCNCSNGQCTSCFGKGYLE
jgi:hypothetical protein